MAIGTKIIQKKVTNEVKDAVGIDTDKKNKVGKNKGKGKGKKKAKRGKGIL
ncbi:MAG: hypothetical protein U9N50_01770 [Pseudomonadota bacterium]|nr:hypothetical protein [Pseudomonadota bacterium]